MNMVINTFIDNPLIVKHMRSRLRPSQIVPGVVVILCLCSFFSYIGYTFNGMVHGGVFYTLLSITAFVLVLGGANQVAMTVGGARESGILDFHRVSPLPPPTVSLGFFFGAPIREYVLAATALPFLILTAVLGDVSFYDFFDAVASLLLSAWLIHAVALHAALVFKKPKAAAAGVITFTFVVMWIGSAIYNAIMRARPANAQVLGITHVDFFGVAIPRLLFLAIYEGAATIFFLIAATRKMRAERALSFAKWEALVCMATIVALVLGAAWSAQGIPYIVVALLYVFVVAGIVLTNTITPDLGDYLKGIRRARRNNHRRAPIFSDNATNMWGVFGLAAWVLVGATIAWEAIEMAPGQAGVVPQIGPQNQRIIYSQTIAVGVFTVAYYGFAKQYFLLKFGRRGETFFRLFLFLIWFVPLMTGAAISSAANALATAEIAMGISPWAGMLLSINGGPVVNQDAASTVRFAALLPSVVFAFGFHFLLMLEQRKIDRALAFASHRPKPQEVEAFA